MLVYGHIHVYSNLPAARNAVVNMLAGEEVPTWFSGFYKEIGDGVEVAGWHQETKNVLECAWQWRCQPMPARPPEYPEPWTLCGWTWLCEWYQRTVDVPDTFVYMSEHRDLELLAVHSQYNCDFGYFDIMELRMRGTVGVWFTVSKYLGFATKIGDNLYRI